MADDLITADIPQISNDAPVGTMFAAASSSTEPFGVPSIAIPTVDDPTLTMWTTMQKRIIKADYNMRMQAADDDVFRMLGNIIDACSIGNYTFTADDIDASAETIAEIKKWIRDTKLMEAFKGGGINSDDRGALYNYRVQGEYALWISRSNKTGGTGGIEQFVNLPINGLRRMTNPRDPTQYYFYQKYDKPNDWTEPDNWDDVESEKDKQDVQSTEQKVWYIPDGEGGRDAVDDETKELLYPNIKIDDWVLPLENLVYVKNPTMPLNDFTVSAIMAKRYLVMMTPAAIQLGIVPFDILTFGNENLRPPVVDGKIKDTNPTEYARQKKILDAYNGSIQSIIHNLYDCSTNGKPFGVQWGVDHERIEPKMSLQADFVEATLFNLNQIIAFSAGIPLTIITSAGSELATARITFSVVSNALIEVQERFKNVIMHLLRIQFESVIDEQGIGIELQTLDNTDQKTRSEIYALISQAAHHLEAAGAAPETLSQFIDGARDIPISHAVFEETSDDKKTDVDDIDDMGEE